MTYDLDQRIHTSYTTSQSTGVEGWGRESEPRPQLLPEESWKEFKALLLGCMMSQQGVMGESSGPQMWLCLLHVPFLHEHGWGPLATHSVPGPGLGTGVSHEHRMDIVTPPPSVCTEGKAFLTDGRERMGMGSRTIENKTLKRGEKSL